MIARILMRASCLLAVVAIGCAETTHDNIGLGTPGADCWTREDFDL